MCFVNNLVHYLHTIGNSEYLHAGTAYFVWFNPLWCVLRFAVVMFEILTKCFACAADVAVFVACYIFV